MSISSALLNCVSHRPFPLPEKPWKYYQEWDDTLFLHYKVPVDEIQSLLPAGLLADVYEGQAWVSIVAFTVKKMRLRYLPPLPYLSNFHEINLRTYAVYNGIPGIYFFTVETNKLPTAILAHLLTGIPYKKALLKRKGNRYTLRKSSYGNRLAAKYLYLADIKGKTGADKWLTERYCAYQEVNGSLYRYNIHHKEWPLKTMKLKRIKTNFVYNGLHITVQKAEIVHFAKNQRVLLWGRTKC